MKIIEALDHIDELKPNDFSQAMKIEWLSTLDWSIYREVVLKHEGGDEVEFSGYNTDTSLETELLVPAPYDQLYLDWLESQMNYYYSELGKYNNSLQRYSEALIQYKEWYVRNHIPIQPGERYF